MPRAREGKNVVPDFAAILMEFDSESFLADLDVFGQRSVCETESVRFVDHINDATRAKRIKSQMVSQQRDIATGFDRRVWKYQFKTGHVEHFPVSDRLFCALV